MRPVVLYLALLTTSAACGGEATSDAYETNVEARTETCVEQSAEEARALGISEIEIQEGQAFAIEMCREIAILQIQIDEADTAQAAITDSIMHEAQELGD